MVAKTSTALAESITISAPTRAVVNFELILDGMNFKEQGPTLGVVALLAAAPRDTSASGQTGITT